jgi:hypothetical protein
MRLGTSGPADAVVVGGTRDTLVGGTRAAAGRVVGVLSGYERFDDLVAAPHTDLVRTVGDVPGLLGAHPVGIAS